MKDPVLIERDSIEWDNMWEGLADHPLNQMLPDPHDAHYQCEVWQYMGSQLKEDRRVWHCFRHRCHPATHKREYVHIPSQAATA